MTTLIYMLAALGAYRVIRRVFIIGRWIFSRDKGYDSSKYGAY